MESTQEQSFTDITRTFLNNQDNLSSLIGPSVCGTYLSVFLIISLDHSIILLNVHAP